MAQLKINRDAEKNSIGLTASPFAMAFMSSSF